MSLCESIKRLLYGTEYTAKCKDIRGYNNVTTIIAERLSARQLIVQCGLQISAYIYIFIYVCMCPNSVMLRNAIESQVIFRTLYVYIYVCNSFGPGGRKHVLKMASY